MGSWHVIKACAMGCVLRKTPAGCTVLGSGAIGLGCAGLGGCGLSLCDLNVSLPPRSPSTPGTLAQPFTASVSRDATSHPHTRGLPVPRRATEPRTPRSRAQRHPFNQDSPLRQRVPRFLLQPAMAAETGEWGGTWVGQALAVARLPGLKKSNQQKSCITLLRYKISDRFIVRKFEITGRKDTREQKKKVHCKLSVLTFW